MIIAEFGTKQENAVLMNERFQQEAQSGLDDIENPDVAEALRQDNSTLAADSRANHCPIQLWPIPIVAPQTTSATSVSSPLTTTLRDSTPSEMSSTPIDPTPLLHMACTLVALHLLQPSIRPHPPPGNVLLTHIP